MLVTYNIFYISSRKLCDNVSTIKRNSYPGPGCSLGCPTFVQFLV
jgi:hypothetical protein